MKALCPDALYRSVFEVNYERLWNAGFRVLIFDIDNTLGAWGCAALDGRVLQLLQNLAKRGFRLGFLSNDDGGADRSALTVQLAAHSLLWKAKKPRTGGYSALLKELGCRTERAVMIGDQLFTDIWGAKRAGLYAVMTAPFDPQTDTLGAKLRRPLERWIVRRCCSVFNDDRDRGG